MRKAKAFIKTSIIGGVAVILPAAILTFIFKWIFSMVTDVIQPLTNLVMAKSHVQEIIADILVIAIIITGCFILGVMVKTRIGTFVHEKLERRILGVAPGYSTIKEIVIQFIGRKQTPFSSVVLAQVYENETLMTAFVTDQHPNGYCTVFVPTGPNPTSGNIFHLKKSYVHPVNVSVEHAMRSIISCGAGSTPLMAALGKGIKKETI